MNSAWARWVALYRRRPASFTPIVVIVVVVLVANIIYVLGLGQDNPITWTANFSHYLCRAACGRPAIDPNVGFITVPFGHLAATDLLHGHLPWWNYYEGLGQPLAGEMQSAALFPLTLLFAMSSGLVWFHISLEVIAGVSSYFLARRLGLPLFIATGAGVLFALNGTISWLGNAVLNPVAFLPMLVLGVEIILDGARTDSKRGWYVAALALALSIYAGFPEVAYLDALFAGVWAIVRVFDLPRPTRLRATRRLGLAGGVGLLMSLPIFVPFYDFVKVADLGNHSSGDAGAHLAATTAPLFFDPYVYGTIFHDKATIPSFGAAGGYFGAGVTALALLGMFGRRLRPLRTFLTVWVVIGFAGMFDLLGLHRLWNVIPLVKNMAFARYVMPSIELGVILLAVLGVWDFLESGRARQLITYCTVVAFGILGYSVYLANPFNDHFYLGHKTRIIFAGLDAIPFLSLGLILLISLLPLAQRRWNLQWLWKWPRKVRFTPRALALLLVIVVCGESLLYFWVPTAQAPKKITVDTAPITFLATHEGQDRFLDFGVIIPNWGTEFHLNELSEIDLPFPKAFATYITTQLEPGFTTPPWQFTVHSGRTGIDAQQQSVVDHLAAYEAASLKYLLIPTMVPIIPALTKLGFTLVYQDAIASIYQVPHPTPFFSSPACTVTSTSVAAATVSCPKGGSTLVRSELSMAGWHVAVNGKPVAVTTVDGVFQSVAVPSGTSTVTYTFSPPHELYALIVGVLATLFWFGSWLLERLGIGRRRVRRRPQWLRR